MSHLSGFLVKIDFVILQFYMCKIVKLDVKFNFSLPDFTGVMYNCSEFEFMMVPTLPINTISHISCLTHLGGGQTWKTLRKLTVIYVNF